MIVAITVIATFLANVWTAGRGAALFAGYNIVFFGFFVTGFTLIS